MSEKENWYEVSGEITEIKKAYLYLDDNSGEIRVKLSSVGQDLILRSGRGDLIQARGILRSTKTELELQPTSASDIILLTQTASTTEMAQKKNKRGFNNLAGVVPLGILMLWGGVSLRKLKKSEKKSF